MKQRFALIYFAAIVAQIIIRRPYIQQHRQQPKADQRISSTERGLLLGLFVGLLVLPLLYTTTTRLDAANYQLAPRAQARIGWVGSLVLALGLWLFWRSHHDLGANWSPTLEIGQQHTLTIHGVYRTIRHPMYASQFLWCIAQTLLLPNWVAGWAGFASFLPLYLLRVPNEEQMMLEHFGEAYRAYCASTGRILPRLSIAEGTSL